MFLGSFNKFDDLILQEKIYATTIKDNVCWKLFHYSKQYPNIISGNNRKIKIIDKNYKLLDEPFFIYNVYPWNFSLVNISDGIYEKSNSVEIINVHEFDSFYSCLKKFGVSIH